MDVFQENQSQFAFGRDLILLPQCHLTDMSGTVPKYVNLSCIFSFKYNQNWEMWLYPEYILNNEQLVMANVQLSDLTIPI